MKTSSKGINQIKEHEALRLKAYLCPAGVPTIGWGTTKNVQLGATITEPQAEAFLAEDLRVFENFIRSRVKAPINQNQFDALVSLVYNIGTWGFGSSTVLAKINSAAPVDEIKKWWLAWDKIRTKKDGKPCLVVSPGLVKRRASEFALYCTPII